MNCKCGSDMVLVGCIGQFDLFECPDCGAKSHDEVPEGEYDDIRGFIELAGMKADPVTGRLVHPHLGG